MVNVSKNADENYSNILETLNCFFSTNWTILLIGFVFSITRIHYLTYPLGLLHRQIVKEGFRSYEAVTGGAKLSFEGYFELPIFVLLLEIGYNIFGKSPDGLVFWGRSLGFISSILILILIYKITEIAFGDIAAKFAAFLYAICPYGIFVDIGIQRETLMWLFGICAIFCILKYLETDKQKYVFLNLTFSLLAILTKFTGIYFLFASIASLILFYSLKPIETSVSLRTRLIVFFSFFIGIIILSVLITLSSPEGAFSHTIVYEPDALFDTEFWGPIIIFATMYIPVTTVLLGILGLINALSSPKKEILVIIIWIFFAGMEIIFYGYGAVIHEYYIFHLLHPLVIFAGNTLFLFYQFNQKLVINNGLIPTRLANPVLVLFLFLSSGFIPLFNFSGQVKVVVANKQLYEDIRSIGLFLHDYDIQGHEIAIIFDTEEYDFWKYHLTLARTYIAKPFIYARFSSGIMKYILDQKYKAIIGWSDDLIKIREELMSYFGNYTFYPQNTPFRNTYDLPAIELWFQNV